MQLAVVLVAALVGAVNAESAEVPSPCTYDECAAGVFSPIEVLMAGFAENADRIGSATDAVACALDMKLKASKLCDDRKEAVYDCVKTQMERCANMSSHCAQNYADALAAIGAVVDQFNQTHRCEGTTRFLSKHFVFHGCNCAYAMRSGLIPRFSGSASFDTPDFTGSAGYDHPAFPGRASSDGGSDSGEMGFVVAMPNVKLSVSGSMQMSGEKSKTSEQKSSRSDRDRFRRLVNRGRFYRMRRDTYGSKTPLLGATCDENCPYDENLRNDVRVELCLAMQDNFKYFDYPPSAACPSKPDNCDKLCDDYKLALDQAMNEQDKYVRYVIDCLDALRKTIEGMENASDDDLMGLCTSNSSSSASSGQES